MAEASLSQTPQRAESAPSPALAPPPGNPHFPLCDSLRGIGVMGVILGHSAIATGVMFDAWYGRYIGQLGLFVLTFFTLSAFLLYRPFVAARVKGRRVPRAHRFWRRRALRIIPAYWTALTLLAIWPGVYGPFSDEWWVYYGFLQSYSADWFIGGIAVAWTLCVEMVFYLLLPFWAMLARRIEFGRGQYAWLRGELLMIGLLGLSGVVFTILAQTGVVGVMVGRNFPAMSMYFALGMAIAVISVAFEGREHTIAPIRFVIRRGDALWIGAAVVFIGLALYNPDPARAPTIGAALADSVVSGPFLDVAVRQTITTLGPLIFIACFALPVMMGDWGGGLVRRFLSLRFLIWVGVISYAMYIWHEALGVTLGLPSEIRVGEHAYGLGLIEALPDGGGTFLFAGILFAITLVVAAASYYIVELPFLRKKETSFFMRWRRQQPTEQPAEQRT